MLSINDLLNHEIRLPSLSPEMPPINLRLPTEAPSDSGTEASNNEEDSSKAMPYTMSDDLEIFKCIVAYYGTQFTGKIPWSFWQTYKQITGSPRSNSSLYHHWNGAMKKKYAGFINTGRLNDCIMWLESAIMSERSISNPYTQHTGTPLCHNRSSPPVQLSAPQFQTGGQTLCRFVSYPNYTYSQINFM